MEGNLTLIRNWHRVSWIFRIRAGLNWFDKYGVLLDKHYFGDAILSTDSSQAIADFATGKTAMMIHTSSTISEIRKVSPDMKLGLTATPVNNAGEELYANWKSGLGFAVSDKSKNKRKQQSVFWKYGQIRK